MDLHPLEQKVLEGLQKLNGKGLADEVAKASGIEKIQAERFGYSLSQKGIVKLNKIISERIELTELGRTYLEKGLPEIRVLRELSKTGKTGLSDAARKVDLSMQEVSAIVGILRKNGWVSTEKTEKGLELDISSMGKQILAGKSDSEKAMEQISKGEIVSEPVLGELKRRGLISIEKGATYELVLLKEIKEAKEKSAHQLTHEMLQTGSWKKTKFRGYDLKANVPGFYPGKLHPLTMAISKIRRIFLELGFEEAYGPVVESSFWNFDALFQPQDHPARDLMDTFYLKDLKCKLPEKYVPKVKQAHEKGIAESKGWRYPWNKELSKKAVLRTHTTAVTARWLTKIKPPAKVFCIGRTYRNETVDFKHLPEFTQIDGIVVDENVTFRDLLGYLKEFFNRLGFKKIRFRPAYFPYTEMSVEPEVYLEDRKEWIELGGSGIFRPEVTEPLGIKMPVLAWGLSLERPVMLRLGLDDIRNFYYKNDLKILREVPVV